MSAGFRSFAVVPAAGRSRRMGQPKLLLPLGDQTLFEHLVSAWTASGVERVVVVIHPNDKKLAELARNSGADVVVPDRPPEEMKISVRLGLEWIEANCRPAETDAWLLAPADMPRLDSGAIDAVLSAYTPAEPRIIVPKHKGRRGHPVLFPWKLAADVARLGPNEGVSELFSRHEFFELDYPDPCVLDDVDTPEDYERLEDR